MKNPDAWKPTKFERHREGWRASRNATEVFVGSRIVTDIVAQAYGRALAANAGGHLVDVGCGKVPLYGMYAALVDEVTCVDWPGSLHGSSHVDRFVDLNGPMPFADASFDTVLCSDVIEHIWNHDMIWAEMARVLRPGGRAIIGTPFMYWLHEEPHDYFRWTPHSMTRWAEASGLVVHEITLNGGAPEVLADIVLKSIAIRLPRVASVIAPALSACLRTGLSRKATAMTRAMPLTLTMVAEKI